MKVVTFGNLRTLTWLLGHVDETQEIMAILPDVEAAMALRPIGEAAEPFVEATIPIQRKLASIMADCPLLLNQAGPNDGESVSPIVRDQLQAQALAAKFDLSKLLVLRKSSNSICRTSWRSSPSKANSCVT